MLWLDTWKQAFLYENQMEIRLCRTRQFESYTVILPRLLLRHIYKQWNIVLCVVVGSEMHYLSALSVSALKPVFILQNVFLFFFPCLCDEFISPKLFFPSVLQDAACGNNGNRQEIKLRHLTATDLWGVSLLCAHHIWPTVDPFINAQHSWRSSLVDTPHQPGRGGSSSKTK